MKHAPFLFPLFLLIFSIHLSAEGVVIRKILDSNLFEIKGGQKVRLAYIDAPSITDPNPQIRALARTIRRHAKAELLKQSIEIEFVDAVNDPAEVRSVRIWKKFPLQTVDFIKKYLENGFGKLAKEAGLPIEETYQAAEQKAKRKRRGVWSPSLYKPVPPKTYANSLLLGRGSTDKYDGDYTEAYISARPFAANSGFAIRAALAHGPYSYELSTSRNRVKLLTVNLYWVAAWKHFGFEPGVIYMGFPYYSRFRGFALPNARLKIGDLEKFYLSLDLLTDLLYSPFSVGVNFESNRSYYYKLWIGITPLSAITSEERWLAAIKLDFGFSNGLLLKMQALQVNDRYDPTRYGLRFGVGYRFPVGRR